ncbi:alpha/beta hydrolase [Parendozoicomonas haliclonae]|uniref:Phospholipase YtpA n=1 Tax=Parendozoicomonas haliclonae TaxID=1960125 RepID=A0A1X7AJP9_9GAMM|nr:alpha/beta hydrolase [Parendozoicomonas haliclonae]SMA41996.1 Phospholipase YtpA [Parendozoicomonas haliclonae]
MALITRLLDASDFHQIPLHTWQAAAPKATVLILHGMAEHGLRYGRLAETLNQHGYNVAAIDHRGHGQSVHNLAGIFSTERGWERVLDDVSCAYEHLHENQPELPVFILGHSMGSFITQSWLMQQERKLAGVVLSGSTYNNRILLQLGRMVTRMESLRLGADKTSRLVDLLTFGSYNNGFKPARTPFDWLSADTAEVDAYIADPLCGFQCTNSLWLDLFQGLLSITSLPALQKLDSRLPFYIFGGDRDPVGQNGKGLRKLAHRLTEAGVEHVDLKVWPGGRHEMLNESNRDDVTHQLVQWLDRHIPQTILTNREQQSTLDGV